VTYYGCELINDSLLFNAVLLLLEDILSYQVALFIFNAIYFKEINKLTQSDFLLCLVRFEEVVFQLVAVKAFDLEL
jgi:hypothetical protein